MTTRAYYNEVDPFAAAWLRELINRNLIAPGDVDERDIKDVLPSELQGYTQHHFFAGIGVWSYALRLAGWPDDKPVWTGSCPCQPFSVAGKGAGTSDERHLWPSFFHLIEQFQPSVVFGEQVEAAIRLGWLDLVQDDMEGRDYAFAAAGFGAASVGAPHIRQRLYFVADSQHTIRRPEREEFSEAHGRDGLGRSSDTRGLADTDQCQPGTERSDTGEVCSVSEAQRQSELGAFVSGGSGETGALDNTTSPRRVGTLTEPEGQARNETRLRLFGEPGPTNGHWRNADWIYCRDEKYRPVEPGTFPLAHGATNRVGRLRGYGNAIVAQQAAAFITAYMESIN